VDAEHETPTAAHRGRTIFLGDVQGCREELERLLELLRYDPAADRLEPTGDLVNRGPDSAGVLRLLRALNAGGVLGNHDVALLRTARGLRRSKPTDTFGDVLRAEDRGELLGWLRQKPFVRQHPGILAVHAGVSPLWHDPVATLSGLDPFVESADLAFAITVRYCDEHGARPPKDWPPPGPPFEPWFHFWPRDDDRRTIVFGHWARLGLIERRQTRGIDTGCVWGNQLTAWIAEEDRMVQVAARRAYATGD
jgi:bis(5'-nucleosyl)-tetraphosphatase (symmetrical)